MLRDILNERRWNQGDLYGCALVVRHRGAPNDERTIPGHAIQSVLSGGVELISVAAGWSFDEDGVDVDVQDSIIVPFHRVLVVRGPNGETLWAR